MAAGYGSLTEIENMSLDDVDLLHLWLDAVEEAQIPPPGDGHDRR